MHLGFAIKLGCLETPEMSAWHNACTQTCQGYINILIIPTCILCLAQSAVVAGRDQICGMDAVDMPYTVDALFHLHADAAMTRLT